MHSLNEFNWYERILRQTFTVLEPYSSNKASYFFGFGAETYGAATAEPEKAHIAERLAGLDLEGGFPFNLETATPESIGIDNLITNYKQALKQIQFEDKSMLAPSLLALKKTIKKQEQVYYAVIVMVAGEVCDFEEVKEAIVELSHHPCSIVVIGVSDTTHEQFDELNAPGALKDRNNNACVRKMAQFIRLSDTLDKGDIAEQALMQLPKQMCQHLERVSFKPSGINSLQSMIDHSFA